MARMRDRAPMAIAAGIGAVVAFVMFGASWLFGTHPFWLWPADDPAQYLSASLYFLRQPWILPLFDLPALNYPEGSSVILNDAIPLGAFVAKVFYSLTGIPINHIAVWPLIAYALQGAMAVRLVRAMGEPSVWATVCLASWTILCWPLLSRFGHYALMSQFLLLWALALYTEQTSRRGASVLEQAVLVLVSALINPYLCVMVLALSAATYVTLWRQGVLGRAEIRQAAVAAVAGVAVLWVSGYLAGKSGTWGSQEVGVYTWNPITLIVPPTTTLWPGTMTTYFGIARYGGPGQYEGESYLGLGPVLIGLICLVTNGGVVWRTLRRHWVLALAVAGCAALALSPRIYIAHWLVLDLPLPTLARRTMGIFRSQGRFIWPAVYLLLLGPAVLLLQQARHRRWIAIGVVMATALQVYEAVPVVQWLHANQRAPNPILVEAPQITAMMRLHERLWIYPSWWCGGAQGTADARTRLLQIQILAARLNMPSNSAYTARPSKHCDVERTWRQKPTMGSGTLYLFVRDTAASSTPAAGEAIDPSQCRDLGWSVACSTQSLSAAPDAALPRSWFEP